MFASSSPHAPQRLRDVPPLERAIPQPPPESASKAYHFTLHRVCTPGGRENVLRLKEPKNEQKRLKERETSPPSRAAED